MTCLDGLADAGTDCRCASTTVSLTLSSTSALSVRVIQLGNLSLVGPSSLITAGRSCGCSLHTDLRPRNSALVRERNLDLFRCPSMTGPWSPPLPDVIPIKRPNQASAASVPLLARSPRRICGGRFGWIQQWIAGFLHPTLGSAVDWTTRALAPRVRWRIGEPGPPPARELPARAWCSGGTSQK